MARKSMVLKQQRKQKFSTREYSRCRICGRPHAYLRKDGICRSCFRGMKAYAATREKSISAGTAEMDAVHPRALK